MVKANRGKIFLTLYNYECIISRVVDGDTVDVDIDLGFDAWLKDQRVRLIEIDAPEVRTRDLAEKQLGLESKEFLKSLLPQGKKVILLSKEFNKGKYGRIIGDFILDNKLVTEILLENGKATYYDPEN